MAGHAPAILLWATPSRTLSRVLRPPIVRPNSRGALNVRATGAAVLAVFFMVGGAAQAEPSPAGSARDATVFATTAYPPPPGGGAAASAMDVVKLAQAAAAPQPPPNDVFTPFQNVGPWRIVKVFRDGKFHRCRAELGSVPNQLLVVKWATRNWGIAIANSKKFGPKTRHTMVMEIGRASQRFEGQVDAFGLYLSKVVPQGTIDAIRDAARVQLTTPMGTQTWSLSNTSAMAGALDDCFKENSGAR